jgi:SAM-dependent methyltransferase
MEWSMAVDRSLDAERASDPWLNEHTDLLTAGMTVLELGCGNGDDCADLVGYGIDVVAFDQFVASLRRARRQAPGIRIVRGDMRCPLPFRNEQFDAVVASLSIHYFDWATSAAIVSEVRRVVRPGGWFISRVNSVGDVNFEYGKGAEIEPDFFEVRPGHFKRFFTEDSLRRLLDGAFDVDSIVPRVSTRWTKEKQTLVARAQRRA